MSNRNLNPHAEARLAMALWDQEYANQRGGSMGEETAVDNPCEDRGEHDQAR